MPEDEAMTSAAGEGARRNPEGTFESSEIDALEARLAEIERALGRLDDGSYGTCERCGERLPAPLVVADPAASRCVAHATTLTGSGGWRSGADHSPESELTRPPASAGLPGMDARPGEAPC